jgi:hypothetical protein
MNNSAKITRTITITGNRNKPNEMYYEIEFMTFKEYINKLEKHNAYIYEGKPIFKIYPYKWFDVRKFYQIPAYWFLRLINKYLTNQIQVNKRNHNIASSITFMSEIVILLRTLFELFE